MQETRERAKNLSPTLVLTLLSIIQALALEVLWSSVRETAFLWEGGRAALNGWLQVAIAFQGIIVLWVAYLGLVVRFVWIPRIRDMVIPFVLGLFEFVIASALHPDWMVLWFLLLAALFLVGTLSNSSLFLEAAKLHENREHFDGVAFESPELYGFRALYGPLLLFEGLILVAAGLVAVFGPGSLVATGALVLTNGVLILQFLQIRFYWNRALFAADAQPAQEPIPSGDDG